jgi:iron-sulfur cluster repair protein YtfE (RIC family)
MTKVGEWPVNRYLAQVTIVPPTTADMESLNLARRTGWPEDLRVLIARFPREQWEGHANLGAMARFWLSRHAMFRELSGNIELVMANFLKGAVPAAELPRQLVPRLQFLLSQLNVHHQIEDQHYFPIFRAAAERLARGFDVLEGDHHAIHADMAATAETANALLRALAGNADSIKRPAEDYAQASNTLIKGLIRHLDDEEDLIVPLILERGEAALGVAHHG